MSRRDNQSTSGQPPDRPSLLVVDDEEGTRELLARMLRSAGLRDRAGARAAGGAGFARTDDQRRRPPTARRPRRRPGSLRLSGQAVQSQRAPDQRRRLPLAATPGAGVAGV